MAEQSQALGHSQAYNGHGHLHQQQQQLSSSMDMQLQADVTGNPVYMSTSVASIAPSLQQPQNQQPQEMVAVQSSLVQDAIPSGFMGMDPSHEIMLPSVNMTSQAEAAGSAPSETSTSETKSSADVNPKNKNSQLVRTYDTSHLLLSPTSAAAAAAAMVSTQTPLSLISDRCLDSFYHHFFAAHPFVLPKTHLLRIAKDGQINHLLAAIRYIGSLFINVGTAGAIFYDEAFEMCYSSATPKDGFLVQAMVLLILGLDGNCQRQQSRKMLLDVEKIALDINLHTRPFATMYGRGIPVLEESWRRTWWDLYVIDGMFAGVHRETNFALYDVPADVALPCEEDKYINETIPTPMYLQDLEDADFSGEDREFSSFAYRIASGRILGKMMRTPEFFGPDDENIDRIETLLTNWRLHLPPSKQSSLNKDLELDEMMFQATMMNRTHFFICVITHSSIIHLSKWALYFVPYNDDDLRQQIRLHIGALNKLSSVWKAASTACGQVRGVAQEIYRGKKAQAEMPGFWEGLTADQVITSMANDESMMSEIDALTSAPVIVDSTFASVNSSGQ
ncbi:hypothetical protein CFO_g545 [Ceratocystis platani]|uniref:Xylanolytic transcriptional activator regulatory domain-containing protein n=1 Tax=Ceratocystis fimbriata f. sp. platani TaxID=88771 RepID=A0A0F8B532_CERFI|nr:hypothetical protein CFO_g545 [Ceratocystis platani]